MDERRVPTAPESGERASESPGESPSEPSRDGSPESRELTPAPPRADTSPVAKAAATGFVTVTHEILFADDGPRCDVCGDRIPDDEDPETALTGSGLYVWSHGGEIVYEEPPLCASCGTAIGMSALARWEIDEEEG